MKVESLASVSIVYPSETRYNGADEVVKNTQRTAESHNKPSFQKENSIRELKRKSRFELSVDEAVLLDVINRTNKAIKGATCSFEYSVHETTKDVMIKVIDKDTKEVIREIPPEKILDLVAKLWEIAGFLVDERR